MPRISERKRLKIIEMTSAGISDKKISQSLGISRPSVAHYRLRLDSNLGLHDAPKSGRPKLVSDRLCRKLRRKIVSGECQTAVDVRHSLLAESGEAPSTSTIKRCLRRVGLKSAVKTKKPFLSIRHRRLRLSFAKKYRKWTIDDWKRVIFSDESKIQLFGSDRRKYYWRMSGD